MCFFLIYYNRKTKIAFKHQDLQIIGLILNELEVLGRGSETQPQVGENFNSLTQFNPLTAKFFNLYFHSLEVVSR